MDVLIILLYFLTVAHFINSQVMSFKMVMNIFLFIGFIVFLYRSSKIISSRRDKSSAYFNFKTIFKS